MQCSVRDYRKKQKELTSLILSHKRALNDLLYSEYYRGIVLIVQFLNNRLHRVLTQRKLRKLPRRTAITNNVVRPTCQVVTIPADLPLSDTERHVLSLGLSYCPTPATTNQYDLQRDLQAFLRRIQLQAHFHNRTDDGAVNSFTSSLPTSEVTSLIDSIAPRKSSWNPPPARTPAIAHFIDSASNLVRRTGARHMYSSHNLTQTETLVLHNLSRRQDIIIKHADKGGAVVVWDRNLYVEECQRLLANSDHYTTIDSDPTAEYQQQVKDTIVAFISDNKLPPQARKLIVDEPCCSVFYCLPKIHKPNNPGCPIVSTINCPTSLISKFVDSICQPLVKNTASYLKDTNHALTLLNDFHFSGRNRIIVTGDVSNLYTVISHAKGLRALRYFLDKREVKEPATDVVVRLAELVLTLNAFEFDSSFYKQLCGVAMGTRMGPSFACLYLAYLEERFFETHKGPRPDFFRRYIDDLLFMFSCTPRQAKLFLNSFSELDSDLQFTWSSPDLAEVPFLDIKLKAEGDRVSTSVYSKETDTHAYLLYSSFHPRSLLKSIPYSQYLRIRRLCSDDSDFIDQCTTYATYFRARGYLVT